MTTKLLVKTEVAQKNDAQKTESEGEYKYVTITIKAFKRKNGTIIKEHTKKILKKIKPELDITLDITEKLNNIKVE